MPVIKQFGRGSMLRDAGIIRSMLSGISLPSGAIDISDYVDTTVGLSVSANKVLVNLAWTPTWTGLHIFRRDSDTDETAMITLSKRTAAGAGERRWNLLANDSTGNLRIAPVDADAVFHITNTANTQNAIYLNTSTALVCVNDSANANMTTGITVNQGAADNEILTFKSSDVAHGITDVAETDSYGFVAKASAASGGTMLRGATEATIGLALFGYGVNDDTTKSVNGVGYVTIDCGKKSGTGVGALGTDANALAVRANNSTRLIVSGEGNLWWNGALNHTGTTVGFYGVTPVTRQAQLKATQTSGGYTASGSYDSNEESMLNALVADMTNVFTWLTDMTTKLENTGILE